MTTVNFDFLLQPTVDPFLALTTPQLDYDLYGTTNALDQLFGVTDGGFDFPNFDTTTDAIDFNFLTTVSPDIFGITEPFLIPTTIASKDVFWPTMSTAAKLEQKDDKKSKKKERKKKKEQKKDEEFTAMGMKYLLPYTFGFFLN